MTEKTINSRVNPAGKTENPSSPGAFGKRTPPAALFRRVKKMSIWGYRVFTLLEKCVISLLEKSVG